jgi:hypothetical protein
VRDAFLSGAPEGILLIAGPGTRRNRRSQIGDDRVLLWAHRVEPSEAHVVIQRAAWAVCHYASRGRYAYFTQVLYPSSVAAAVCVGTRVLAPDLPSVREITEGHSRILYRDEDTALVDAFADASRQLAEPASIPSCSNVTWDRWRQVMAVYRLTFKQLCGSRASL